MTQERVELARELMSAFAERTGLDSARPQTRYLWTDAFAVCNFFALVSATGEIRFRRLAIELIDRVHHTLGRHRPDDGRGGWISGLDEREGAERPTCGGLRIGKPLPERPAGVRLDPNLEWERDGQYFHYLTRWMHALDVAARITGDHRYHRWSRELAEAAFSGFVSDGGQPWIAWKMSIDLSRPLVPSTGQLDPIDGLVTYSQLESTRRLLAPSAPSLAEPIGQLASMAGERILVTSDPLGIGGLLAGACRLAQLETDESLIQPLYKAALGGLVQYSSGSDLRRSASHRLAFRELGLAIGLAAVAAVDERRDPTVEELRRYLRLREIIESFWIDPAHRQTGTWRDHLDINEVMLATALVPAGYLELPGLGTSSSSSRPISSRSSGFSRNIPGGSRPGFSKPDM